MTKPERFSDRERQVIARLLEGESNKQIALELGVSLRTVEFHLSNIYAKLGVGSRTEAVLKLSKPYLRESTEGELRESTVRKADESGDNVKASINTRRIPMNKSFLIGFGILVATAVFCVGYIYLMAKERAAVYEVEWNPPDMPLPIQTISTETPTQTVSAKEHILEQIRQLIAEYEQAIQSEKKNGDVEFSKDPVTGEDIFKFKDESYNRIWELNVKLWENISQLNTLYVQVYRDELRPTPFPTQLSSEQNEAYLQFLYEQAKDFCPTGELDPNDAIGMIYDPDEGKYMPAIINEEMARCETYGQMIEEWRTAPMLARVNQDADMAMIRQVTGKPDLILNFQAIQGIANALGRNAAVYSDETGMEYSVDVETTRLVEVIPNFQSHPNIPAAETKSMDELRGVARQFASTNSPRLADLESVLLYEENCKGDICFFRWDYRTKDWTGTDWMMMPPFLQVGVLANGQIVTYNNTLDLFE